ncbi:SRPBCC family protein [Amycolatopsis sp. NPDC059657]|uniref:SRPBCC family protein n=1 Tax=Amycolatopsis sp. NPDC059657 TaxID=3346899 RepID=UPI00366A6551
MTETVTETRTQQVYRIYIKATPQAVWDAITKPEFTAKYGYTGLVDYELRPGGKYVTRSTQEWLDMGMPEVIVDGEVIEADPPRKLVQTWRLVMSPEIMAEGFTKLTYEIFETKAAGTRLTVTHDVTNAPATARMIAGTDEDETNAGGGWAWILCDLKSLLETGSNIAG